jgi:hypothetical protein
VSPASLHAHVDRAGGHFAATSGFPSYAYLPSDVYALSLVDLAWSRVDTAVPGTAVVAGSGAVSGTLMGGTVLGYTLTAGVQPSAVLSSIGALPDDVVGTSVEVVLMGGGMVNSNRTLSVATGYFAVVTDLGCSRFFDGYTTAVGVMVGNASVVHRVQLLVPDVVAVVRLAASRSLSVAVVLALSVVGATSAAGVAGCLVAASKSSLARHAWPEMGGEGDDSERLSGGDVGTMAVAASDGTIADHATLAWTGLDEPSHTLRRAETPVYPGASGRHGNFLTTMHNLADGERAAAEHGMADGPVAATGAAADGGVTSSTGVAVGSGVGGLRLRGADEPRVPSRSAVKVAVAYASSLTAAQWLAVGRGLVRCALLGTTVAVCVAVQARMTSLRVGGDWTGGAGLVALGVLPFALPGAVVVVDAGRAWVRRCSGWAADGEVTPSRPGRQFVTVAETVKVVGLLVAGGGLACTVAVDCVASPPAQQHQADASARDPPSRRLRRSDGALEVPWLILAGATRNGRLSLPGGVLVVLEAVAAVAFGAFVLLAPFLSSAQVLLSLPSSMRSVPLSALVWCVVAWAALSVVVLARSSATASRSQGALHRLRVALATGRDERGAWVAFLDAVEGGEGRAGGGAVDGGGSQRDGRVAVRG